MDSVGKMFVGGAGGVRAYAQGNYSGDEGYLLRNELQWLMNPGNEQNNSMYIVGFYDCAGIRINKTPLDEDNKRYLQGAGVGLIWRNNKNNVTTRLDYAWRVGTVKDADKRNGRLWMQTLWYI